MPAPEITACDALRVAEILRRGRQSIDLSLLIVQGYDFAEQQLTEAVIYHAELSRCRFGKADLFGISIQQSLVVAADWRGAQLDCAEVSRSNLSEGCFDQVTAKRSTFVEVDLRRASFRHADLRHASFKGCDLRGAVLDRAVVLGAVFLDCRLSGVSWEQLRGAPSFGVVC